MYFCNANLKINMTKEIHATNILLKNIINAIQNVKGESIISLDLRELNTSISDYFIICTGNSNTQVKAIEGSIRKLIKKNLKENPLNVEGNDTGEWILMDYSDIIIHIFQEKTRAFYNIEEFWGDAKFTTYID